MKKIFVSIMMLGLAMSALAVDLPKQGFGLQIGWAQPILRLNSPTSKDTLANTVKMNGFKLGVVYDASFIAGFGSSMGINYTFGYYTGPWKSRYVYDFPKDRMTVSFHQLELFVDWQYKFEVAKETYLILYTGPTIQCGVALGMRTDQEVENPMTGERTRIYGDRFDAYNIGAHDDDLDPAHHAQDNSLKRLNVTWGIGAGFQYKRYFLRGGYDFGLINPYKNADFVNGNHTRGRFDQWAIKVGVYLWYAD